MPAEEAKTTTDSAASHAADAKKGGKNKLILFGGIGGGAVVIGVLLALFVVKPMLSGKADKTSDKTAVAEGEKKAEGHDSEAKSEGEHGEAAKSSIYTIKDIVVNPAGTGGSRYLSASIALQLASPEEVAKCQELEPIIRDALITILSSKSVAQLTDPREKEIARLQIKNRVTQLLKTTQLAGVYYTDFVLQ